MNERLRAIIEDFCASTPAQVAALAEYVRALAAPGDEAAQLSDIRHVAHRLAGTARSMGFEHFGAMLTGFEARVRACQDDPASIENARADLAGGCAAIGEACAQLAPRESRLWRAAAPGTSGG